MNLYGRDSPSVDHHSIVRQKESSEHENLQPFASGVYFTDGAMDTT